MLSSKKRNSTPNKLINLYISYTLDSQLKILNTDFTLSNCLFGSLKLTKNPDLGKYKFKGYGIGFDPRSEFLITDGSYGEIFIFFLELIWAHMCMLMIRETYFNYWCRTNT